MKNIILALVLCLYFTSASYAQTIWVPMQQQYVVPIQQMQPVPMVQIAPIYYVYYPYFVYYPQYIYRPQNHYGCLKGFIRY